MSNRLNQEKEEKLTPVRFKKAIEELKTRGFNITEDYCFKCVRFKFKGKIVSYYPYTGWATGKTIKDGRGLRNLLKQLDGE